MGVLDGFLPSSEFTPHKVARAARGSSLSSYLDTVQGSGFACRHGYACCLVAGSHVYAVGRRTLYCCEGRAGGVQTPFFRLITHREYSPSGASDFPIEFAIISTYP